MTFSAELNAYCVALGCTSRELAEASGISASTLSRYRSGKRTPNASGEPVRRLAAGIARMAEERDLQDVGSEQDILLVLTSGLQRGTETFSRKLDSLMRVLGISNVEMSRHSNVDPSYLSRIRNGKRSPAEPRRLAESCAEVIVRHAQEKGLTDTISLMTGEEVTTLENTAAATARWLLDEAATNAADGFGSGRREATYLELVVRLDPLSNTGDVEKETFASLREAAHAFVHGEHCMPGVALRLGLPDGCASGDIDARCTWLRQMIQVLEEALGE